MKTITTFLACLIGLCPQTPEPPVQQQIIVRTPGGDSVYTAPDINQPFTRSTLSGNYLASRFAQRNHDWGHATELIQKIIDVSPEDLDLKKRAMVLAMGDGDTAKALQYAKDVLVSEPQNSLALLFVAMEQFKNKDYAAANASIAAMPEGSLSSFIMPLLHSWGQAAIGVHDTAGLQGSTIHIYHAILIADFLNQHAQVEGLLAQSLRAPDLTSHDLERIADLYGHIGKLEEARALYTKILEIAPEDASLAQKIAKIDNKDDVKIFERIQSAEDGLAETMFDMARVLYTDYSDESARIFGHLALMLNPERSDAKLLLGYIASRNNQFDEAIAQFQSIGPQDEKYFDARRLAADLLEDHKRIDEALAALQELVASDDDIDALVQIGDIYRRSEQFEKAIDTYNQAQEKLGGTVPADYWRIHYARGMAYEQLGDLRKSEEDLLKALEFQPEHPFVLNYLGYSWADQGVNLKQSLEMIRKAVALRPDDGYITDSLGWVLYKMGKYQEAVPYLEQAVELLPYDPVINDHLGDSYWKVGRKLEARFQWERAKNHSEDEELLAVIAQKLENGLASELPLTKAAQAASPVKDVIDALE